ncbi:MAG TPA: N-acetylmuramoyl-L-alanine amidase, partial [Clostridia bacterium]|nr:N-acetylmuramoyl-L-alanine amidase [Clostridia bacterium]
NLNASLFVSIHSNAFTNSSLKGIMTLVYPVSANNSKITGKSLGRTIQRNLVNITGAADRGVIDRPNLVVLNSTKMPAALVECGFMTNPDELKALQSEEYQDILARGIVRGILDTLNGK